MATLIKDRFAGTERLKVYFLYKMQKINRKIVDISGHMIFSMFRSVSILF